MFLELFKRLRSIGSIPNPEDLKIMDWELRVIEWAKERNLIEGSSAAKQMRKLLEETGELAGGIANNDQDEIADAIGDCCVVLCIMSAQRGLSFVDCLEGAWKEIKDRKGKMVDGVFVKEPSLYDPDHDEEREE